MLVAALAALAAGCTPAGADRVASAPPHELYRYLGGPITMCGEGKPLELGGWADDTKPPLPWPRTTEVLSLTQYCVALSDVQSTAYGGTTDVTAFRFSSRTRWPVGSFVANQFASTSISALAFLKDCTASYDVTTTQSGSATTVKQNLAVPATAATVGARKGSRPHLRRAPTLNRNRSATVVGLTLNRDAKGVTVAVGDTVATTAHPARSTTLVLRKALKTGRRYAVTVTACDDGCTTRTYRVAVR